MVLIEAMAYGVPCISYNCPCGPQEIITEGDDGFLVNNGDVEDFAKKIEKLIIDKSVRLEMGVKARKKASKYLPDEIVPQWDILFKKLTTKT